jgi:hypothetical protein
MFRFETTNIPYQKAGAQAEARPSQAKATLPGPAYRFVKPEPPKARPKPGLPGQARAGTSLQAGEVHKRFVRVHTTLVTFSYLVISDRIRRNDYSRFWQMGMARIDEITRIFLE